MTAPRDRCRKGLHELAKVGTVKGNCCRACYQASNRRGLKRRDERYASVGIRIPVGSTTQPQLPWEPLEAWCEVNDVSLKFLLHPSTRRACDRFRRRGTAPLFWADDLCTRLGVHPCEIWPDWLALSALSEEAS